MAKKTDIKKCRYTYCKHESTAIDITRDSYKNQGNMYYHEDCYKAKAEGEWKDAKTKADLQLIKNLWVEHISDTVVFSQLFRCLNDLLQRGVESDYLVFVMQYCISHKLKLRYPMGFKYYVDNQDIKKAYKAKQTPKQHIDYSAFSAKDTDDAPTFSISQKKSGFGKILGGGK